MKGILYFRHKVLQLDKDWKNMNKNKSKTSEAAKQSREKYKKSLDMLFDIAAPRAEEVLDTDRLRTDEAKEEDLQFLEDQRGPHKLFIGNRDMQYDNKVKAKSDCIEKKV